MENKNYTILIVDDEDEICELLSMMLGKTYNVLSAKNAQLATDILRLNTVDLILLDIKMPGPSGFDFCKSIKQDPVWKLIPIIFVSSSDSSEEIITCYELYANDFVSKPFIKGELLAKIKIHLKYGELSKIENLT